MNTLKRAKILHVLNRHAIPHSLWEKVTDDIAVFKALDAVEKAHLRELTTLFLYQKKLIGVQGLDVTSEMSLQIAAQACLPILGLGIDSYEGWHDIILYPGAFQVTRDNVDENGIVHHETHALSGESWSRGPLVLSWQDITNELKGEHPGRNVIVHEFAHKLDAINGRANGMPPLHSHMNRVQWTEVFSHAYDHLHDRLDHHHRICINPYATTSPAEFFAVTSEYFFSAPEILHNHLPAVYQQLSLFYRQNPLQREKDYNKNSTT